MLMHMVQLHSQFDLQAKASQESRVRYNSGGPELASGSHCSFMPGYLASLLEVQFRIFFAKHCLARHPESEQHGRVLVIETLQKFCEQGVLPERSKWSIGHDLYQPWLRKLCKSQWFWPAGNLDRSYYTFGKNFCAFLVL